MKLLECGDTISGVKCDKHRFFAIPVQAWTGP